MPVEIEPSWVGRRVTVRRVIGRGDDGRSLYGDVVGDLVDLGPATAVIEQRGALVEVALDSVAIAKLVPPSSGEELALEAVAARGWRAAEIEQLGGWLLRANEGFSGRANSVLPLKAVGLPLREAIAEARSWYAARSLPLRFAVPTESRRLLDAELGENGWIPSADILVMTARLDVVGGEADPRVGLADDPDDAWLQRYGHEPFDVARDLLTRHERVTFAATDGRTAVGRGAVDEDWLGLSAVTVAEEQRRNGLGRALVGTLCAWGREHGATRSYAQVWSDDDVAVRFWEALGYREHHAYRYRDDPDTDA